MKGPVHCTLHKFSEPLERRVACGGGPLVAAGREVHLDEACLRTHQLAGDTHVMHM